MKTKKNCLQAWRREVIRYRTQLNHLLRVLQVSGVKCRYNIFFRVMKKRYVAFKKAAQLEVEVQLRSQGAWLRHWRFIHTSIHTYIHTYMRQAVKLSCLGVMSYLLLLYIPGVNTAYYTLVKLRNELPLKSNYKPLNALSSTRLVI